MGRIMVRIVPNVKVRGQQACPEVKKKCCIVYIYIVYMYMRYPASMMFTCIKVLSHLLLREGARVKYKWLGQTTSCWVGQDKQGGHNIGVSWERAQSNQMARPGWTFLRGAARDSRSSMYKMYIEIMML
jgi:hypothetical protein